MIMGDLLTSGSILAAFFAGGVVRWQGEYPTMYLSAPDLISKINENLPH